MKTRVALGAGLSDEIIRTRLAKGVLLGGSASLDVQKRGLGDLLGAKATARPNAFLRETMNDGSVWSVMLVSWPLVQFAPSDAALRKALPLIESNRQLLPGALFYLGLANYKMEKIPDALKFFNQCAATPSPFQAQAKKNIAAIRTQYVVR